MLARKLQYDYHEDSYIYKKEKPQIKPAVSYNTSLRRNLALIVSMILIFAFYMVMRNDVFIQNGYALVKMQDEEMALQKEIKYLEVVLAEAKSPARITALAENIGMVQAGQSFYVRAITPDLNKEETQINTAWNR